MPKKFTKFMDVLKGAFAWIFGKAWRIIMVGMIIIFVLFSIFGPLRPAWRGFFNGLKTTTATSAQPKTSDKPADKLIGKPGDIAQKPDAKAVEQPKTVTAPSAATMEWGYGPIIILQFKSSGLKPIDPSLFKW